MTKSLFGQSTADCANLVVVCGNRDLSLNANGVGQNDFANANNQSPSCGFVENQSLWLRVPIAKDGLLEFSLNSNNNTDDFDFAIYGPNVSCNNLGAAIRCSSTNPQAAGVPAQTGLSNRESDTQEGPGALGNGFVSGLEVKAGEEYIIFIDNFSRSNAGFSLVWDGTAEIEAEPEIESPPDVTICDPDGDGLTSFDLTATADIIGGGSLGTFVSFHRSETDALTNVRRADPRNFTNTTNPERVYARLTNNGSGCSTITSFLVMTNPAAVVDEIVGASSVCPLVEGVPYSVNGSQITSYTWVVEGGTITSGLGTDRITVDWGVANDNAAVKLIVANDFCQADEVIYNVKINKELEPETPRGNVTVCYAEKEGVRYEVPFVPGSEYEWGVEGGTITGGIDANFIEVDWADNGSLGKVFFREFNPSIADCEGFSDTLQVEILPEILISSQITSPLCNGDRNAEVTLTVSGGTGALTVNWDNGVTGLSLTNQLAGTYPYTLTDESGCEIRGEVEITEPDELVIIGVDQINTLCFDTSDGTAEASVAGGTGSYRYNWTGPNLDRQTTVNRITNLPIGTYNVTVHDENDCVVTSSFTIGSPPELTFDLETLVNLPICPGSSDGEIDVTVLGGTPDYQFFWQPNTTTTTNTATGLAAGTYSLRIVDANGCEANLESRVEEFVPRVTFPTAFSPNGDGENDEFGPIVGCPLPEYNFKLYNRWGELIFYSENQNLVWDGTFEGKTVPEGRYTYTAFYRVNVNEIVLEESLNGAIRIFR